MRGQISEVGFDETEIFQQGKEDSSGRPLFVSISMVPWHPVDTALADTNNCEAKEDHFSSK